MIVASAGDMARQFMDAVNTHDVDRLCGLMTEDHQFTDAHGHVLTGAAPLRLAWSTYFEWFPDYRVVWDAVLVEGQTVLAAGTAAGTWKGSADPRDHWELPAAWRVVVRGDHIAEWQVFCDTKIVFEIISRNST